MISDDLSGGLGFSSAGYIYIYISISDPDLTATSSDHGLSLSLTGCFFWPLHILCAGARDGLDCRVYMCGALAGVIEMLGSWNERNLDGACDTIEYNKC